MNDSKLFFIGSYVSENVSGSHRQERFIIKGLELGFSVILIKPSGNWKGVYNFTSSLDFYNWKNSNKLLNYSGSISSSRFKKFLLPLKQLLLIDVFGYGFLKTLFYLFKNKKSFSDNYSIIVSSPQVSLAFAVYLFKLIVKKDLKYNVDMRDAWARHKIIKYLKHQRILIEKYILRDAQNVLTVSNYLKEEFELSHNIKVQLLYNVNVKLLSNNSIVKDNLYDNPFDNSVINICYFGSMPKDFYDLKEFCLGLQDYLNTNIFKKEILFHFYGPCYELEIVLEEFSGIRNICVFNSSISHYEVLSLMKYCDAVLFLGYSAEKNAGVVEKEEREDEKRKYVI